MQLFTNIWNTKTCAKLPGLFDNMGLRDCMYNVCVFSAACTLSFDSRKIWDHDSPVGFYKMRIRRNIQIIIVEMLETTQKYRARQGD